MIEANPENLVSTGGAVLGLLFGFTMHRSNFCMMGAIADIATSGDRRRWRAWLLAIAVSIAGSQFLSFIGLVDFSQSIYLQPTLPWLSLLVGGLLFGFGMVIAGGCSSKGLVNAGAGDLRALIALLILGLFAYMTINGLFAYPRLWIQEIGVLQPDNLGQIPPNVIKLIAAYFNQESILLQPIIAGVVVLGLCWYCLSDTRFRHSGPLLSAGIVLGVIIVAGWWITGVLGYDEFQETNLTSITFVRPTGDSLLFLLTFTGAKVNFGITTVGGMLAGAFFSAVTSGRWRLIGFADVNSLGHYMTGGALMGIGGVLAFGCTAGQGLTGISTLSLGSILALVSIILGAFIGMRYLEFGSLRQAMLAFIHEKARQ